MVQVKFDINIAKEWFGTSGEFIKACKAPGVAAPSGDPAVLTKWLVSSMYVMILTHLVGIAYWGVAGDPVQGVSNFVSYSISAFIQTWIVWYSFVHRGENSCCPVFIFCILDFKPAALILGVLLLLSGVLQAFGAVMQLLGLLSLGMGVATIMWIVFVVFYCLYAVCMIGIGLCMVKLGGKQAGVEVPGADKVGAPSEQTTV